jgi:hypothetical protein
MKNAKARLTVLAASVAALTMSLAAQAATVGPADASFYNYPNPFPAGNHGTLISYRTATVKLGATATAAKAWNVVYKSTDSVDVENAVTGTVIVPTAAWSGTGARPVILYAVGTHGLAQKCAPSLQLAGGTDYEAANINAALKAGYAVLVTDYQGYLTGDAATYLAGKSQGQAVLDIFKAAQGIPGSGIDAKAKVGVWGFSQGGQSAAWAAESLASYAPEINVAGVAAGGIPADFIKSAYNLDGSVGAAFLASGVAGLNAQYPDTLNIDLIASADGFVALDKLKTQCVFEALFDLQNRSLTSFTNGGIGLDQILKIQDIKNTLIAQNLGTKPITTPMYQFHGQADEFIPLDQDVALKNAYCTKYPNVYFDLYPSEHIVTQFQAAGPALAWMADRFNGKAAPSTCSNTAAAPASTSNPTKGTDLIVSLTKWPLAATIGLKTLAQTISLPAATSLTADSNITKKTLNGSLSIPAFKSTISLIGLKISVGLTVTPVGNVTGSSSLDNDGLLHIKANAQTDITITSLLGIPFGQCKTVTPVNFPINFDGPLSSLGNGNLTFTGTTTFPQIKGCVISAILSALMSGSGQTYSFNVAPPAPVKF